MEAQTEHKEKEIQAQDIEQQREGLDLEQNRQNDQQQGEDGLDRVVLQNENITQLEHNDAQKEDINEYKREDKIEGQQGNQIKEIRESRQQDKVDEPAQQIQGKDQSQKEKDHINQEGQHNQVQSVENNQNIALIVENNQKQHERDQISSDVAAIINDVPLQIQNDIENREIIDKNNEQINIGQQQEAQIIKNDDENMQMAMSNEKDHNGQQDMSLISIVSEQNFEKTPNMSQQNEITQEKGKEQCQKQSQLINEEYQTIGVPQQFTETQTVQKDYEQNIKTNINQQLNIQILQDFIELKNSNNQSPVQNSNITYLQAQEHPQSQIQSNNISLTQQNQIQIDSYKQQSPEQMKENDKIQQMDISQYIFKQNEEKQSIKQQKYISRHIKLQQLTFNIMISHQMTKKMNQEQVSTPIKSEDLNFQSERSQIIVKEAQLREEETFQRQENQEEKVGQIQKGEQLGIQIQNTSQQSLIQDKVKKTQQMIDQTSKIVVKQAEIISESVKIIERQQIKESVKQQMKITQQNIVSKVIQQIKEKQPQIPQILIIPEVQAKDQSINKPLQEQRLQEQRLQKKDVSIIKIQTNVKIIQQIIKNPSESAQKTQLIKVQEKAPAVILSKKIQEKSPEVNSQQKIQEKSPSVKDKKQDIQVGKQVKQQEKKEPMIDHIKIQEERQKKKQLLQSKKKENLQQLDNQKKLQKLSALQAQQQQEKPPVVRRIQKKANNKQEQPEKSQKQQQQVVKKGKNKQQKPKKKKKKYIPHEKQKEQQKQIYKKQPSTAQQIGLPKPNPDKRNIPQNISAIKKQGSIVSVHIIEEQVMSQSIKMVPILTSSMIIIQAQKERVGTTYKLFLKYLHQYDRTVSTHLRIIKNVQVQMQKKKNKKQILMKLMTSYFENYSTLNRQFYQSSSKIQAQARPPVANKFISIRDQLKPHYEQLNNMRKTVANNCNRIDLYIKNTVLVNIAKVFQAYFSTIMSQESRHQERRQQYINRQSIWRKTISQIDKNFNKGLQRKQKEDLFKEIARMINEEKNHREYLKLYGRGLINLRKISIQSQKQLFDKLQQILARYKQESKVTYSVGNKQFNNYFDFINIIKTKNSFEQLCTLVDADYIKYVLQIHNKKEIKELTNKVFQDYLQLEFFDKVVGNIKNLYKGAINKIFPLQREHEELIHTISGNLVYFDREKDLCHDKYAIKNVNAKIIAPGEVQFDQIIKGFIFDDNRTARLKLKDIDRAQELICYLNEKEDNIIIESIRKI